MLSAGVLCCLCRRVRGDAYYELLDEFLSAVRRRYGNTTLLQFEDMTFDNATKLLSMYRYGMIRTCCTAPCPYGLCP
jgi:hypothetical protein